MGRQEIGAGGVGFDGWFGGLNADFSMGCGRRKIF